MATINLGPIKVQLNRDAEGHREYRVTYRIESDTVDDGPATALLTPGLPVPGSRWEYKFETDPWAFCRFDATVKPEDDNESTRFWQVEFVFSTKPPDLKSCKDTQVEDPLLEPAKISGSFIKFLEEATFDRFGRAIRTSSFEQIRGSGVEFDKNRNQIRIVQNVASALQGYILPNQMVDCLNGVELWGLPIRCIKLSAAPWDRRFFGTCNLYYERSLEFEVNVRQDPTTGLYVSGFDRDLMDEGTKALNGHWDKVTGEWVLDLIAGVAPDPNNPQHFNRYKDRNGENAKVILDGFGLPSAAKVRGTATEIVADASLDGPFFVNLAIAAQPPKPSAVVVYITDVDESIDAGHVTIVGKDSFNNTIREDIEIGGFGTTQIRTTKVFKTITEVSTNGVATPGPGFDDRIRVTTDDRVTTEGKIHVEKYPSVDFLLLGIPLIF